MRWFLVGVAAVGMLAGTVLLLGIVAFRSHQANRQLTEAVAAKQAEPPPAKLPAPRSNPASD